MICFRFAFAFAACGIALTSDALAYSNLFVFGDSLSEVGNLEDTLIGWPNPPYYEGRFSNGYAYSELLAAKLDLPPLTFSRAGGNNFAYGGAKTTGTGFPNNLFVRDVDDQVGSFLNSKVGDPEALYLLWAGANDLIGGQTNMSQPTGSLAAGIRRLYQDGGRQFLVLNLPKLGTTPRYNGNAADLALYNDRTASYNLALDLALDDLELELLEIDVLRFDVEQLFDQVLANPTEYGLTNVHDSAAPSLSFDSSGYDESQIVSNPDEYLFWDDLHPTRVVHAQLADAIFQFLTAPPILPGDFNADGHVDLADYTLWRDNLGSSVSLLSDDTPGVDAGDYTVWRENFGRSTPPSDISQTRVPEPGGFLLAAVLALMLKMASRPRNSLVTTAAVL